MDGHADLLLTRAQTRDLDRLARDEFAIPTLLLMENAAHALAQAADDLLSGLPGDVLILAGPGNNGGDGLALARHLHVRGLQPRILLAADPDRLPHDARINFDICRCLGLDLHLTDGSLLQTAGPVPSLVVDAILGTGLDRPVSGAPLQLIHLANSLRAAGAIVLAADLPSGLDADTGEVLGRAVHADVTISFASLKPGLLALAAQPFVGRVFVRSVGHPPALLHRLGVPPPTRAPGREPEPSLPPAPAPRRPGA